jgi:hypothetical protein
VICGARSGLVTRAPDANMPSRDEAYRDFRDGTLGGISGLARLQ